MAKKKPDLLADWKKNHRTFHLWVDDPRHTEVLGYRVSTTGKKLWASLDWSDWWIDHSSEGHMFSHAECMYFHVKTKNKYRGKWDGTVYRVRCWYAGGRYNGWPIESIGIGQKGGRLYWIVRCNKEKEEEVQNREAWQRKFSEDRAKAEEETRKMLQRARKKNKQDAG